MERFTIKRISGICINRAIALFFLSTICFLSSCNKAPFDAVDPYPSAPVPLVKFLDGQPVPALGNEGTVVTFKITGLKTYAGKFTFYLNQLEAEVIEVADEYVKVKVPVNASTGAASVVVNNQVYFGPTFSVKGKIYIDPLFITTSYKTGTYGSINGIIK